jgi:type I restriction enzyme, S subunit
MLTDSFTEHSIRESKGSTNPYINWPDIAKYEFSLPPLDEQKRVAEILWAADEAVEKYINVEQALVSQSKHWLRNTCLQMFHLLIYAKA